MRIGDILLADGVIGEGDLEAALSEQLVARAWGDAAGAHTGGLSSRLGSILFRRGAIPADVVARALAAQLGAPAALSRHLERRDPALAAFIPAELALRFVALPVAQTRGEAGLALIVCMRDPNDAAAVELIAHAARMPIVPAVACEAVLAPMVAAVYGVDAYNAAVPGPAAPEDDAAIDVVFDDTGPILSEPIPRRAIDHAVPLEAEDPYTSGSFQLVGLDEAGVARDPTQVAPITQRPSARVAPADLARTTGERPALRPQPEPIISLEATRARLADAGHRDEIADAAIAFLAGRWSGAVILLVRDGLALGQRGFGGALDSAAVEAIVVPLNQPSVLRTAHDKRAPFLGVPTESGIVHERFLRATGAAGHRVAVMPVSLRERVVCLVFAHGVVAGRGADTAVDDLRALTRAMEASFLRLIRDSKRSP